MKNDRNNQLISELPILSLRSEAGAEVRMHVELVLSFGVRASFARQIVVIDNPVRLIGWVWGLSWLFIWETENDGGGERRGMSQRELFIPGGIRCKEPSLQHMCTIESYSMG